MSGNLWRCVRLTATRCGSRANFNGQSATGSLKKSVVALDSAGNRKIHSTSSLSCIADGGGGTHKPSPFQKKVFVWTKVYKSEADVPDRVTRSQMKNAMDKFRVRVSIGMVAMTFIFAAVMALIGRKARNDGQTITKISLARRQD